MDKEKIKIVVGCLTLVLFISMSLGLHNFWSGTDYMYRNGVNKSRIENVLTDIDKYYFESLKMIEFKTNKHNKYSGRYLYSYRNNGHRTFNRRIIIYDTPLLSDQELRCLLLHELGHHHDIRKNFLNHDTRHVDKRERSADNFMMGIDSSCNYFYPHLFKNATGEIK